MTTETLIAIGSLVAAVVSALATAAVMLRKQSGQDKRDDFRLVVEQLQRRVTDLERDRDECRADYAKARARIDELEAEVRELKGAA